MTKLTLLSTASALMIAGSALAPALAHADPVSAAGVSSRAAAKLQYAGALTFSPDGVWSWRPEPGWRIGAYQLVVGSSLEDVSGNRVGEALDHDVGSPDVPHESFAVRFTVERHFARAAN